VPGCCSCAPRGQASESLIKHQTINSVHQISSTSENPITTRARARRSSAASPLDCHPVPTISGSVDTRLNNQWCCHAGHIVFNKQLHQICNNCAKLAKTCVFKQAPTLHQNNPTKTPSPQGKALLTSVSTISGDSTISSVLSPELPPFIWHDG